MQRIALVTLFGILAAAGCSKSPEETPPALTAAPEVAPPDAAVRSFLEAIRIGDHKAAETMLTETARKKTSEMDLLVAPPGSLTAKFEIGASEVIENQVAHVASVWTDVGEDGKPQANEFIWALRRQPEGWRVAGVAVQMFPNQPPLLLDFEDPADMLRKQQMAEAEARRQMQAPNGAGQNVAGQQNIPGGNVQAGGANVATGQPGGAVVPTSGNGPAGVPFQPGVDPNLLQGTVPQPGQINR